MTLLRLISYDSYQTARAYLAYQAPNVYHETYSARDAVVWLKYR